MYAIIPLLLLIISVNCQKTDTTKCEDLAIQRLCIDQEVCDQCLQAHPCCNWCYDEVSDENLIKRFTGLFHFIYLLQFQFNVGVFYELYDTKVK